jgi:hypothetical protein
MSVYETTRRHIPQNGSFHSENLKSQIKQTTLVRLVGS